MDDASRIQAGADAGGVQPPIPPSPSQSVGRYAFCGSGLDYFLVNLTNFLLSVITLGVASLLGYTRWRKNRWFVEHVTLDGQPFAYRAGWTDELGQAILSNLLVFCTCGFALPWVIAWNAAVRTRHTTTGDGRPLEFRGTGLDVIGLSLLTVVGMILSLGVAWPLLAMAWQKWRMGNTLILDPRAPNGQYRLRLDAGPLAFLVQGLLSHLLVVITLGFYRSTALLSLQRFVWASTSDELSQPVAVKAGPRTVGEWAAVSLLAVGAAGLGLVVIALLAGATGAASRMRPVVHDPLEDRPIARVIEDPNGRGPDRDEQRPAAGRPPTATAFSSDGGAFDALHAELADEDVGVVGTENSNGWGNRCFLHIKAGRLAQAKAACERGLQLPMTTWVHGALLYNMGLIAQAVGDKNKARAFYAESLQVRPDGPGVSTVQRALDALGTSDASGAVALGSLAGMLQGTHSWTVQAALTGSAATNDMPCTTQPDGAFSCMDDCGKNEGFLRPSASGSELTLEFSRVCGRPKAIKLTYTVVRVETGSFRLERRRDWQQWTRSGPQ